MENTKESKSDARMDEREKWFYSKFKKTGMDLIPENFIEYCVKYSLGCVKTGLFLYGNPGTGKTRRMEFVEKYLGVKMISALELFECYTQYGQEFALDVANVRLKNRLDVCVQNIEDLIIDDLGTEPPTANIYGTVCYPLADIIEYRYMMFSRHGALTHFTSNKTMEMLSSVYGERALSRISEMCSPVNIFGKDRRIKIQG